MDRRGGSGSSSDGGSGGGGERAAGRRDQILEAAAAVLASDGFEKITTRRIARQAGVNIATLHYHFGTKEALLAAAMRHALFQTESILREAMAGAGSATEALERAFDAVWKILQERPGILRYDLVLRALRDEAARHTAHEIYRAYRRIVDQIVERHIAAGGSLAAGITTEQVGQYAVAAVDGILLQYLITGDDAATKSSLDLVRQHVLSLLLRGEQDL